MRIRGLISPFLWLLAAPVALAGGCAAAPGVSQIKARPHEGLYRHAAVATDHQVASEAALEMLNRGGNAVDAAVAASFTLSVVRPYSCGIGGGGFMVIHVPPDGEGRGEQIALNYRETAAAAVGPDYYVDLVSRLEEPRGPGTGGRVVRRMGTPVPCRPGEASRFGPHAAGVPGTVAGLAHALEEYGTLGLATVLGPAIRAAEEGVAVDANYLAAVEHIAAMREAHPHRRELIDPVWRRLCREGRIEIGDVIRQPEKARALRLIAERGPDAFYRGAIAEAIAQVSAESGGPITRDDLDGYTIDVSAPLRGSFQDFRLIAMPPPSSGGIALIQILGMIERRWDDFDRPAHNSPGYTHLLAEAMQHAFADRAEHLADAAFVDVPVEELIDPAYLDDLASRIQRDRVLPDRFEYGTVTPEEAPGRFKGTECHTPRVGGTSHLSVIDADGMAVACTETINLIFGSLVMVEEFGIVLNNQMDDFTTLPGEPNVFGLRQSDRNGPEPGKRPLSSMSPTILLDDSGRAVLIAGASGGPRIISATMQAMLNVLTEGRRDKGTDRRRGDGTESGVGTAAGAYPRSAGEAVAAPRVHHQWMPETFFLEPALFADEELKRTLEAHGHEIAEMAEIGVVQLVRVRRDGTIEAASDPRKGGRPAGY